AVPTAAVKKGADSGRDLRRIIAAEHGPELLEAQPQRSPAGDPFETGEIAAREGFRILSGRRRIGADGRGAIDEPTTHLL
ncbi:MAG TPA: hypothetical protein VGD41_10845, partial [Pyrinomonadaceae bacterium]